MECDINCVKWKLSLTHNMDLVLYQIGLFGEKILHNHFQL